ncbi:helix-turn-helix domain-containing protein [Riemerella columbipharyngis]|uniref:Transcriptional regulator, contains XRE-family HTH domain n=1 Tax=Riemerella columbipharyngis TaxID=1071918 RepID=A0A1G6Y2Q5_9FLAO|nr:helix-turn-helix transcriptional regulator [Riemerella columbipharyngis]SDD84678.1 Transcriptional regulator, contains XRE-family HTH domain [Riemerella columbipharyngis]
MNSVGFNIRKIREKRGFSQDYVAQELNISQASYARLENENTKITVDRLYKIAEILEVDISDFFNGSKLKINTQNNYEGSYGNGYIQNLYVDNKEIVKKLIESYETIIKEKDEQIKLLKEKLL